MSLNTKRLLFIIISWFSFASIGAQTLYWVGGSGNFNDPSHWSLSSGGVSANIIPSSSNDVVFDDNSGKGSIDVNFPLKTTVRSLISNNYYNNVNFNGVSTSSLFVSGSIDIASNNKLDFRGNVFFKSVDLNTNIVQLGKNKLKANVFFQEGNYSISSVELDKDKKLSFENGHYIFKYSVIKSDQLVIRGSKSYFKIDTSSFLINKKVSISDIPKFDSHGFGFLAPFYDSSNVVVSPSVNFGAQARLSSGYTSAVGDASLYAISSCSGSCSATFSFVIDPANTGTFNLIVSNGNCPATAASISTNGLLPGSSFTVGNVCYCPTANFTAIVFNTTTFLPLNILILSGQTSPGNFNFTPPSLAITPLFSVEPTCNLACDGSMILNVGGGTQPYTVTVAGPVPTVIVTANAISLSNLCKGSYTITALDANGCSSIPPLVRNLTAPSQLVTNAITNSISCNSICNGSFSISPNGSGTSPYTVVFSNSQTLIATGSQTVGVGSLCIGAISATVTDAKGCTASTGTTIIQPTAPLSVVSTQTNLICNSVCNGAASATASGGTAPYSYNWSPATGTNSSISNLCAGTQTLTVTDFNGCLNSSQTFTITQPPAITLTPTQTNVICSGASTGAASISPSGGTGGFSYTWTAPGPPALSGNVPAQTNLLSFSAPYTVNVTDGNNCTTPPVLITITQPPAVTLAITNKSVSCFGFSDGGATVTASGGNNASYTYTWMPGSFNTPGISGLVANTYSLTVRDASACGTQTTVTIIQPSLSVTLNATLTSLNCNIANRPCDGSITANPTGGTPPYSYTLTNGVTTNTNAPPYTGLCASNYTFIVRDVSGCPQQTTGTLSQPNAIVPSIATTSVACFGASTGGLTGSGSGGTPSYSLTWTTPSGTVSGAILSNQPAGNYTLSVVDSKSCTAQSTATITQPSSITVAVGTSSISCFSVCNGVLTSTVSGGTGSYNYVWTNSLSANVGSAPTATGLCPGPYTLTITDANLCTKTATGVVLSPSQLTVTAATTPVNCFGDSNGSATVTASGGTSGYVYNFVSSTSTVTNATGIILAQPSGSFLATVTDGAGCVKSITFAITSPTALGAAISGTGSCNACNGTATVTPSFGTAPYSYSWTSSPATTSNVASLCPMNYTATVTDVKGCVVTRTIAIQQIVTLTITPSASGILCHGATTGAATVNATGGTPGYTYTWSPSSQTNSVISGVGAGVYTVTVTDSSLPNACTQTATINLVQPPAITVTATQTQVTCFGFSNGAISATATGGTGSKTYSWSPGNQTTPTVANISAGSYTLLVRDVNLCPSTQVYSITQSPSITITHTAVNPTGCTSPNGSICVTPSGGAGFGYSFNWGPISGTTSCLSSLGGGSYQHTVTDGAGCTNTISVTLFNATGPTLTAVSNSVNCFGASTGSAAVSATGVGPFTFTWSPAVTNTVSTPSTTATGLSSGNYVITCSDASGCVTNTSVAIAQAPSVTLNSTVTPARCNALCNGSITVMPIQGTLTTTSYTYNWLPITPTIAGQGSGIVSALCAGNYTLNLTNSPNCVTQYTFGITQPQAFTVSAVTTSLSCNNVCTGSIVANATGGTGSLNYSWTPVGGNSPTVTNLCATGGTNPAFYTLTVTDQQNCVSTSTYNILQPAPLTNSVNVTSPTCYNTCNATATQVATGGVASYSYSWSSSTITASNLGGLCGGTYTAFVTDGNGCSASKGYTVTPPPALSLTLTPSNPLCNAACNGSISTAVSGAQGGVSYFWTPAASGQNPTGLCATPTSVYTVVVTDQSACQVTSTVALVNPPAITATVSSTNPLCNGNSNGTATVNLSNAIGAINYTWLPTGPPTKTTQAVNGLSAGQYTVNVSDANNCQGAQTFTLNNPPALVVNTAVNPASCGQANGDITANPSGGTPGSPTPYTYTWTGVVSSASFVTGLSAGAYTVAVSDGANCTTTLSVLLNNSSGPTSMPVVSTSITCNAQCTGQASVDISGIVGGTPNYTVSWLAPAPSNSNLITGLCAGVYNAQIEDATGCKGFTNVTIAEPPPISNTTTIGYPLCAGICDGSIGVSTSGGNAPYTYSWSPVSSNSASIANLCAGDYTLMVGYNNGCVDTTLINLPDQTTITIVPTVTNNICFGTSIGKASVALSGGSSPYVASWSNAQNGLTVNNLPNGTYTVVVTDNNGCSNTETTSITSGAQITSTTSIFSPSCGLCNGAATVSATGSGPFNFSWSNSATTPTVSNLCAGIYQVIISDISSCTKTETIIVNNSNGIDSARVNTNQIPCSGSCVGGASVTAFGGTAPITYNWLTPATTGSVINNLCPGTYFVQMVDAVGCVRTTSATINPLVTLTVSPFVYLPSCGASNGSISIAIAGGTPSYNIVWNPPAGLTTSLTNLNTGIYSYTVTESGANACSISNTINVSNNNGPQIVATQTNINCFGQCTGLVSTTVTSANQPLSYAWSSGAATSPSITNLCKGVVTLTVTDSAPCKTIQSFTITDNPLLQLSKENVKNARCFGDCSGEINLVTSGGSLPYTYSWSNTSKTANPIDSLCDGIYVATVTDSKGCVLTSPSYTIKSASSISLEINSSKSSCTSVSDASISINTTGGAGTYSYTWQGPSNFVATSQNISNIFSGSYNLSVLDSLGCKKDTSISISPAIIVVASAGPDQIICPETGSVTLQATGSSTNITYQWSYLSSPNAILATGPELLVSNINDLTSFRLRAVSPVPACYGEDDVNVDVHLIPAVDAGRDFLVPVHSTVTLGGQPSAWGAVSLTWSPAAYLNNANSSNPVASNTIDVTYTLMVTDVNGCISSDTVHVFLFPELNITSGFTPNGDGKNDLWIIDYIDQFPETSVDIFNRWGDVIYSATGGYNVPFDGKYKGADLPVGTYYYVIKLNHPGYPKPITGPLTIFR